MELRDRIATLDSQLHAADTDRAASGCRRLNSHEAWSSNGLPANTLNNVKSWNWCV